MTVIAERVGHAVHLVTGFDAHEGELSIDGDVVRVTRCSLELDAKKGPQELTFTVFLESYLFDGKEQVQIPLEGSNCLVADTTTNRVTLNGHELEVLGRDLPDAIELRIEDEIMCATMRIYAAPFTAESRVS